MSRRGYALRVLGASLMLAALVFWYLESLQHRQSAASAFSIAVFSSDPQRLADPVLALDGGGETFDVRLLSATRAQATVVFPAGQSCGAPPKERAHAEYDSVDVELQPGVIAVVRCFPNRPARSITFTKREIAVGMIRPSFVPPALSRGWTPAHQVRVAVQQGAVDAAEFQGGLTEAVVPAGVRVADGDGETNARYLSRYGAGFAPAAVLTWTDYGAEVAWAVGLVVLAVLIGLFANALYALMEVVFVTKAAAEAS